MPGVAESFRAVRSVFMAEKKLSIAELSQTLPAWLTEQVIPLPARRHRNSHGYVATPVLTGAAERRPSRAA
jgi:hypothetical protein